MPLNLDKKLADTDRVVTPRIRKLDAQEDMPPPSVAGSAQDAVIAALQDRLERMEQQGQQKADTNDGLMAGAIVKQTELMEKILTHQTHAGV